MSSILEMTTTDWVAVYGAVLSTITAVAGGIGWFFRHRIILTHSINMELSDGSGVTYITFEVTNRGSIPTQVTHLHGYYYKSHWERIFFSKRRRSFIVSDNHIPKTIDPGAYWIFFAKQDGIKREFGQNGLLYMGIVHSLKDKSILQRIRF